MKHKERSIYSEEFGTSPKIFKRDKTPPKTYNLLSITNLNQRLNEDVLKEHLHKEFRRFGDYRIEMVRDQRGDKKAFAHFRYFEDAMAVRSAYKNNSLDVDPNIVIEPVYDESFKERRSDTFNPNFPPAKPIRNEKKFPLNYEDKSSTRTLFIGNLDFDITADDLQIIFGKYGFIEDIDIKKNSQSSKGVFAFIRYVNLEMARRAKYEMSEQYIGKFLCRIGYGKHVPSNCLWVGNIDSNVSNKDFENCFASYKPLKIQWSYGRQFAYVVFSSLEVASAVLSSMQGFEIYPGCHIRLDFSDENHVTMLTNNNEKGSTIEPKPKEKLTKAPVNIFDLVPPLIKQKLTEASTLTAVVNQLQMVWKGEMTLKTSTFHCRIFMLCGDIQLLDKLIRNTINNNNKPLPILHKIPLEHKSLDDLTVFVKSDNADCNLLLVLPDDNPEKPLSTARPFKWLLSYLAKKQVAGLTTLPQTSPPDQLKGTIHWLTQGVHFKLLLKHICPKLITEDTLKEDYILAILNTVKV